MSLTSNLFLLFVAAAVIVYYLMSAKARWLVLLVFSYLFYMAGGARFAGFLGFAFHQFADEDVPDHDEDRGDQRQ